MNTSLGTIPEMLYCNTASPDNCPNAPVKAHAGMKWFRSNIRRGSRLALFALAIQFLLSFGHFHGNAQAALAVKPSALHDAVSVAATHALNRASYAHAFRAVPLKTSSDRDSDGRPVDDCAICAVLALADTMMVATPPDLLGLQAAAFSYLIADAESVHLNSAAVAFQPRAPPIS
jgi:hypothetical protein